LRLLEASYTAWIRLKSRGLSTISSWKAANFGAHSRSRACISGPFIVLVKTSKTLRTCFQVRPASSRASRVFWKLGGEGLSAMAVSCWRYSAMAAFRAGPNISGRTLSRGGTPPWGPGHSQSKAFTSVRPEAGRFRRLESRAAPATPRKARLFI
jgi:hypothetical protein